MGMVSSNNMNAYFLPLIFLQAGIGLSGSCCEEKTVGGVNYRNIGEKDTSEHGCISGCIYERTDTPGKVYCFKQGDLPAQCRSRNCPRTVDEILSDIDTDALEVFGKTADVRSDRNFGKLNRDNQIAVREIEALAGKIGRAATSAINECNAS